MPSPIPKYFFHIKSNSRAEGKADREACILITSYGMKYLVELLGNDTCWERNPPAK